MLAETPIVRRRGGFRSALPLVVLLSALVGCAVGKLRPLSDASLEEGLSSEQAFVVIQIDTNVTIDKIVFSGLAIDKRIAPGSHFWIGRVKPGHYRWRSLQVGAPSEYAGRYVVSRHRYARPEELDFFIRAGHVNYMGALSVQKAKWSLRGASLYVRVQNRAAEALRRLEGENGQLLDRYPLATASKSGDRFLEFYSEQRRRIGLSPRAVEETGAE